MLARLAVALAVGTLWAPLPAGAAITFTTGSNTVSTPRFELDFGDANVEWLGLRWRDPGYGDLSGELAGSGGPGPACAPSDPVETWGQAYGDSNTAPVLVAAGTRGTWRPVGGRTVQIDSSVANACWNGTVEVPVRTFYTFYEGAGENKIRVERRFGFGAQTPLFANTQGLRPYVTRLSSAYDFVVHPNAGGSALVTEPACAEGCLASSWNGTWFAINRSSDDRGMVVLRDPANTSPAKLLRDYDSYSGSNNSSQTLTQPQNGWTAPLTEVMYLCFYTADTWPPASRAPGTLPPGCTAAPVPVNTSPPTISGSPVRQGTQLTAAPGTWERQSGPFAYEWQRCEGASCTAVAAGSSQTYTPVASDVGRTLRVKVTATAPGGQADTVTSAATPAVQPPPPPAPANQVLPTISGSAAPGRTLAVEPGGWSGNPTSYAYAWRRCDAAGNACADIAGATGATFVPGDADLGRRLRVRVTATGKGGTSSPAESEPTAVVAAGNVAPSNVAPPTISLPGDPIREDDELTATGGLWNGSTSLAYQWLRCNGFATDCQEIRGATSSRYRLAGADVQRTLRVRVLASSAGGTTAAESAATPVVREPRLSATLVVSPNPTCVSTLTFLDASGSRGGAGGIARYRIELIGDEYRAVSDGSSVGNSDPWRRTGRKLSTVLRDGAAPSGSAYLVPPTNTVGWTTRTVTYRWLGTRDVQEPIMGYDRVEIVLTVTDRLGATAQASVPVDFVQKRSDQPKTSCPKRSASSADPLVIIKPGAIEVGAVTRTGVGARVPCRGTVDCVGALSYVALSSRSRARAATRRTAPTLAGAFFDIPAGRSAQVRAPLTRAGRRAMRGRRRLRAALIVTRRQPDGSFRWRTRRVTLRR